MYISGTRLFTAGQFAANSFTLDISPPKKCNGPDTSAQDSSSLRHIRPFQHPRNVLIFFNSILVVKCPMAKRQRPIYFTNWDLLRKNGVHFLSTSHMTRYTQVETASVCI